MTSNDRASFSIIIPTRDRPRPLAECLRALQGLDYPRALFEVIVVDDGGATSAREAVERARDRLDVALLEQPHAGPAAARNLGASRARGELLAFTDDDCAPEAGWLQALAERLAACGDGAGGRTINGLPANPYSAASQLIVEVGYEYFNPDPARARFFASNNLAVPTDRFREIGGFDASLRSYEDRDLCDRWLARGWSLVYAPDATVLHRHALDLGSFVRQHHHYGRGALHFYRARAARRSDCLRPDGIRPDPVFYARLLARASRQRRPLRLLGLVLLAQCAGAIGLARERLGSDREPAARFDRAEQSN